LGLTDAQRESIYQIQAKHQAHIDDLEKQLDELRAQSLKDCEAVLTADQKKILADRRASAPEARTKRRSAALANEGPPTASARRPSCAAPPGPAGPTQRAL